MLERGPQQHAGDRARCGKRNLPGRRAFKRQREDPAEEHEAQDAEAHGDQAQGYCAGNAHPQPRHHHP